MSDVVMTGDVHLDAIRPEIWSQQFYPTLLEALPFNSSIARDYENDINNLGDIVNIPTWPQFAEAEAIGEDQRASADGVTASRVQLTINKQLCKDFIITSRAMIQSIETMNALRDLAFFSIMKKMQSIIISTFAPSSSAPDHTIAYDSSTTMALADYLEAKELLDGADVPDDGTRNVILGAAQFNDLFNISGFTSRDFVPAGSPMVTASFPVPLLGFNVKMTSEVGNTSYFYHPIALQMAVQQQLTVEVFNKGVDGSRATRVNTTLLFGVVQASNLRSVTIA
jgi:hypothetical protein